MKNKIFLLLSILLVVSFAFSACTTADSKTAEEVAEEPAEEVTEEEAAAETEEKEPYTFGVSISAQTSQFFIDVANGIKALAQKNGDNVIVYTYETDLELQVSQLDDLITQGVDAILVNFYDPDSANEALKRAYDAGIPIVSFESVNSQRDLLVASILSDDYACGYDLGVALFEAMGGEGEVASFYWERVPVGQRRSKGFSDALAEYPNIEHVYNIDTDLDSDTVLAAITAMFQNHPNVKGLWSFTEIPSISAANVAESLGIDLLITTVDDTEAQRELVRQGKIYAALDQQPFLMGELALQAVYDYLDGKEVEAEQHTPIKLITIDNWDEPKYGADFVEE